MELVQHRYVETDSWRPDTVNRVRLSVNSSKRHGKEGDALWDEDMGVTAPPASEKSDAKKQELRGKHG